MKEQQKTSYFTVSQVEAIRKSVNLFKENMDKLLFHTICKETHKRFVQGPGQAKIILGW